MTGDIEIGIFPFVRCGPSEARLWSGVEDHDREPDFFEVEVRRFGEDGEEEILASAENLASYGQAQDAAAGFAARWPQAEIDEETTE